MYIYQLKIDKYIYTGSCKKIDRRMGSHKSDTTNYNSRNYNAKLYKYIRNFGGWKNVEILIIEENLNEEELKHVEDYYEKKIKKQIMERKKNKMRYM